MLSTKKGDGFCVLTLVRSTPGLFALMLYYRGSSHHARLGLDDRRFGVPPCRGRAQLMRCFVLLCHRPRGSVRRYGPGRSAS